MDDRYGNKFLVSEAFRTKLDKWPKIGGGDHKALNVNNVNLQLYMFRVSVSLEIVGRIGR